MYINFQQNWANRSFITMHTNVLAKNRKLQLPIEILTRCTRGVREVFSVARMRSSNSARMNRLYH